MMNVFLSSSQLHIPVLWNKKLQKEGCWNRAAVSLVSTCSVPTSAALLRCASGKQNCCHVVDESQQPVLQKEHTGSRLAAISCCLLLHPRHELRIDIITLLLFSATY